MGLPPSYEEANAEDAGFSGPSSSAPADLPPAYHEHHDNPDEILAPTIYILADDHIFAESSSASPRYHLSRVIHAQGRATSNIELSRVDKRIRTLADGTPSLTTRERHIYNIHYFTHFNTAIQCEVKSVASKGIGRVILQKSPFPHTGYRAIKVPLELETPEKLDKKVYMYAIKEKKDIFEWCDKDGNVVATEVCRDGDRMLLVAVPLTRRRVDALVALWCLWMWYNHVKSLKDDPSLSTWAEVKRVMQRSREANMGWTRT